MTLRIIGGDYRRRLLATPHGLATRPYTDRVRQIVFDRLDDVVDDARVADVFSGVGTMGLESLSRGASTCVFFEGDRAVHECLRKNVETLAGDKATVCWKTNIHRTSFCPQGNDECLPYNLVFFDPPYVQCSMLTPGKKLYRCLERLAKPKATTDDCLIVLRTPERVTFDGTAQWKVDDHWPVSSMNLWLLKRSLSDPTEESPDAD